MPLLSILRRCATTVSLSAALLLCPTANATWSIVITNTATGEVAVCTATCIASDNLAKYVPVIRVGFGAAAAQSQIDQTAKNRKIMFTELGNGTDPQTILNMVGAQDTAFQSRQIGIVDLQARRVTFSGVNCFAWAGGVVGQDGPLTYAIQGNILTCDEVVNAARDALIATQGDVATKLMAAMEAARSKGGDGRCSCLPSAPESCGCPPPTFTKSAHIGCMVIARIGDTDGTCTAQLGCATGNYYMNLNVKNADGQGIDPDPVLQLKTQYLAWRNTQIGRPDAILTERNFTQPVILADGVSQSQLLIHLKDLENNAVPLEGATITVTPEGGDQGVVDLGTPIDLGGGHYSIPLTARTNLGKQKLRVVVDDGVSGVTLYPFPEISTAKPIALSAALPALSTAQGGSVDLDLDGGPALANRPYLMLASAGGSSPGFPLGAVTVPLALDPVVGATYLLCNSPTLTNSCGVLDDQGTARAQFNVGPMALRPLHSGALTFAFFTISPTDFASNPVMIDIGP